MRLSLMLVMLAAGCSAADEASGAEYMDEDFPPWTCDTDAMSGTGQPCETSGGTPADACQSSDDCIGGVCAASFNGDIGPLECRPGCVDLLDDERWCSDAASCCEAEAICDRGYCILPDGIDVTSASTTETSGADTGSSGSESSGMGTGTDTGLDTGSTGTGGSDGA